MSRCCATQVTNISHMLAARNPVLFGFTRKDLRTYMWLSRDLQELPDKLGGVRITSGESSIFLVHP